MKFLIIGLGSIGSRHAGNLARLGHEIYCYDRDAVRISTLIEAVPTAIPYEPKSRHEPIDAFVVCTPPPYHIPFGNLALEHNAHVFVEKPLSHKIDGVARFLDDAARLGRIVQVGYQLRFDAGLRRCRAFVEQGVLGHIVSIRAEYGQWLPDWHPTEDYRAGYTARRDQGGGIILDASHELDYVRWLAGAQVVKTSCYAGKLSGLDMDAEDTAEINLEFANGIIANVHLDCVQRTYSRWCKIVGDRGTVLWTPRELAWSMGPELVNERRYARDAAADPYYDEMAAFARSISEGTPPVVSGADGLAALELALAAKKEAGL